MKRYPFAPYRPTTPKELAAAAVNRIRLELSRVTPADVAEIEAVRQRRDNLSPDERAMMGPGYHRQLQRKRDTYYAKKRLGLA